jgi:hypothetical protein
MSEAKKPPHHNFDEVMMYLRRLRSKGFYGTIHLGFQSGEITQIEPKSVIKPGEPLQ